MGKTKVKVKTKSKGGKPAPQKKVYKPKVKIIASIHKERE